METLELKSTIRRVVVGPDPKLIPGEYVADPGHCDPNPVLLTGQSVRFTRDGEELLTQTGWELRKKDVTRSVIEGKAVIRTKETVDGERAVIENAKTVKIAEAYEGEIRFQIAPDEVLYGLGQGERGKASHRDEIEYLYQNNMKIPMPVFLSSRGYAILFDAGCLMTWKQQGDELIVGFDAVEQIDYYVITAADFDGLIAGLHRLTGRAAMLPRWAFGYIQSRERYKTQDEILETADKFIRQNIPVSCIVLDWHSWEEGKWGNKIVDKSRFPNLKGMVDQLHERGIAFMISVWPNMNRQCENNAEMLEAGALLSNLNTYDAFSGKARELYWRQLERELYAAGTDAWWCDSTEPFTPDWGGEQKLPDAERYELAREEFGKYLDARHANSFALWHARGVFEYQTAASKDKRVANLTRSGSPSIQRYGVILWSGDIKATWDDFRIQVAEGLHTAMSGVPFWTLDIGAFFVGHESGWRRMSGKKDGKSPWFWRGDFEGGVADPGYRELYTRWLQMGAFLPVMRSHGTDTPREPWQFGGPGTIYYDTIVDYIRLRYRLLPYTYSLAARACICGAPIMRHLMFDFPGDVKVWEIADQYMFGPAFLVCPVLEPMEYGPEGTPLSRPQTRKVYLPEGSGWYDFAAENHYMGGQDIVADAPIRRMPLFVRAGSMIPMDEDNRMTIHIYEGADGEFTLYLDSGDGYAYEDGEFARVLLRWDDGRRELTLGDKDGRYPCPAVIPLVLHAKDGTAANRAAEYSGKAVTIRFA